MSSKMLIDASHPEETRVVVLKGNRVEEFDFESANKRQLRGNIYLAKVTRVEPSLQAAFVDYGGNRHGFLAFSEIHPDYYQIPHADRQALLEEEARAHRDEDDDGRGGHRRSRRHKREGGERSMERRGPADDSVSESESEQHGAETRAEPDWQSAPNGFEGETDEALEAERDFTPASGAQDSDAVSTAGETGPREEAAPPAEYRADEPSRAEARAAEHRPATDHAPEASLVAQADEATETGHEHEAEAQRPGDHDEDPAEPDERSDRSEGHEDAEADASMIEGGSDSLFDSPAPDGRDAHHGDAHHGDHDGELPDEADEEVVEQIGGDALEDAVQRAPRPRRHYKIQEVIKRRQILLIQVVKEERGNKGAALTTYLSLAGRYSVLMPNTARGGGISRKITDAEDRKRLKSIAQELEVPEGMGIILRTAGAARGKVEVMRDFEYLLRMWESVRELTLKSTAPALVYEEGSLVKRSIRDLYTRDVEDVIVSGEDGYREAKDFMRMLMPSAAKNVQLYRDPQPIFAKAGAEAQLDAMFSNHVTLKSGGYLVINQTEALVAIDVNSGRSTREHNIEDTALRTNLEAADEVARQLRLRDLAGLIVVDFIDMEEGRNNRAVERRIKDALKNDRARIQIGRISHFGLLEMSRQRIRTGVLEGSTVICPHCAGAGTVRSMASIALHVLRLIEDSLIKDASHNLIVRTRSEVALYILNQKRSKLNDLETRFGVALTIAVDDTLTGTVYHAMERGDLATPVLPPALRTDLVRIDSVGPVYEDAADFADGDTEEADGEEADEADESASGERDLAQQANGDGGRRRKRRRRRRGRDRESGGDMPIDAPQPPDDGLATMARIEGDFPTAPRLPGEPADHEPAPADRPVADLGMQTEDVVVTSAPVPDDVPEPPRRRRSRRHAQKAEDETTTPEPRVAEAQPEDVATAEEPDRPVKRRRGSRARGPAAMAAPVEAAAVTPDAGNDIEAPTASLEEPAPTEAAAPVLEIVPEVEATAPHIAPPAPATPAPTPTPAPAPAPIDPDRPKRSGWWQRAKATFGS